MSTTATDVGPRATAAQIKGAREAVLAAASKHGIDDIRVAEDGTVVVHANDPTYRPVLRFIADASSAVGAEVHVITDDAPAGREVHTRLL